MRISDWSSDVCSSDLGAAPGFSEAESLSNIKLQRRAQIAARKRREILEEARMASRVDVEDVVRAQDQAGSVVRAERAQRQRRVDHRITRRHRLELGDDILFERVLPLDAAAPRFALRLPPAHHPPPRDAWPPPLPRHGP